jgi:hypothetical protein
VASKSKTGTTFTVSKLANGRVDRSCDKPNEGGCPSNSKW